MTLHSRRDFIAASGLTAAAAVVGAPRKASAQELLRMPDMPLHDPFIVADRRTHTYYLYTSNVASMTGVEGTGTMVYRSRNLRDWLRPEVVFTTRAGMWATNGGWAPEVHEYRGRYYLFTTLHNRSRPLPVPPANQYGIPAQLPNYMRGTIVAASDSLLGPFEPLDPTRPTPPEGFMTLDGTLYVDRSGPWMVYAHEWLQKIDGTIEAIRLTPDLSGTVGDPIYLFKGSDAFWLGEDMPAPSAHQIIPYVTDGPQLYRMPDRSLLMLWSTWDKSEAQADGTVGGQYAQTWAVSRSGRLEGPWEQQRPLVRQNSGHGMLFRTLDGDLMMVLHRPFDNARGKLYEVRFEGWRLRVIRQRTDLDGGG
jgi:beta-xylosidase